MGKPFNDLFDGFDDFAGPPPDPVAESSPEVAPEPSPEDASEPSPEAAPGPSPEAAPEPDDPFETLTAVEQLCRDSAENRRRLTGLLPRLLDEFRNLQEENQRLEAESKKWQTLAREYKQILGRERPE